ncbi:MAG: S8 family serine peptidase, partial [Bacteroidota bacterium]
AGDSLKYARLYKHIRELMNLDMLQEKGLTGKGVRIAVFDAGFKGADVHPGFAHVHERKKVIAAKDFYGKKSDPYYHSVHGTAVLGCITGTYEGNWIGAAHDAEFLLARTEHNFFEKPKEEDHWMAAAEWADRNGADLISSSLGYTKRKEYAELDGKTAVVTQAAAKAIRKGILVVNSAGNEGAGKWRYIVAPADADSVLTVGGSYPQLRYRMPFSSFGPNARHVLKPEVSAPAAVVTTSDEGYSIFNGTSFACPLTSGFAACLMQRNPEATNMQIKSMMTEISHLSPFYDYGLGYGVPNAATLFGVQNLPERPTFQVRERNDSLFFVLDPAVVNRDTTTLKNGKPFHLQRHMPNGRLKNVQTFLIK